MFGTVNLDMRSLWLSYEATLFVYEPELAEKLRALQQSYPARSNRLDEGEWAVRGFAPRFVQNAARLLSPLP